MSAIAVPVGGPGEEGPLPAAPARLLLVDDEPDNREVLELVLAWEGFEILQAESGKQALTIAAEQAPDLILLDIMMPWMNGFEVLAHLKADPAMRAIPVMMVSAIMDPTAKGRAMTAGAEDFLSKPINRDDLVRRVRVLLRRTFAGYREKEDE